MPDTTHELHVEQVPIDNVEPADYNPRKDLGGGDRAYKQLRNSLDTFGLVEPLVANERTGRLVGGHQRLKALRELGHETVPVVWIDVDEVQEKQLNIALNKARGRWDDPALARLLTELRGDGSQEALDLLDLAGFDGKDVDQVLRRVGADKAAGVLEGEDLELAQDLGVSDDDREEERARVLGVQSVDRNWFKLSYAVLPEHRRLLVRALRKVREANDDLETPSDALVWMARWWTAKHGVDDA